ncbi:sterile alpha and TIR motif-containing protein 1-like [Tropilaelaps mercedesae]|uniref:Sterile alpha and TIR motif-containing protein 1-like n=1 Tax=Tropilaelaps mercedesae TaxID=418985 RepID=A0A1V9XTY2_9ACAR|nr:sterile alpha and TIR motif-containing protein 1-like [Tropilaelaps mercedesae]
MVDSRRAVPIWLFPLAFHNDDCITYWACLAISVLAANHEIEGVVRQSGTLGLVEPFCNARDPEVFARSSLAHVHGQSKDWLQRFVPVLSSRLKQACSLAAFHFAMEASIKRQQGNARIFAEIGAVDALKRVASSPNDIASKFAARALRIIGEKLPQALSQQVPLWREHDVQQWVKQIGFADCSQAFLDAKVDGDLLLQIDEAMLDKDIGINKQLLRKRHGSHHNAIIPTLFGTFVVALTYGKAQVKTLIMFLRELRKLKQMADYSSVDASNIAQVLSNIDAEFTQYTYGFLRSGVDTSALSRLTEDQLQNECGIDNSVHRRKILSYILMMYPCSNEVEAGEDSKKCIDAFISYRRSTGSQLAR